MIETTLASGDRVRHRAIYTAEEVAESLCCATFDSVEEASRQYRIPRRMIERWLRRVSQDMRPEDFRVVHYAVTLKDESNECAWLREAERMLLLGHRVIFIDGFFSLRGYEHDRETELLLPRWVLRLLAQRGYTQCAEAHLISLLP
jgi:hypothetical protein